MSPAMSSVPSVVNACDFDDVNTSLMPASFCADAELSSVIASSPSLAFNIALTSSAVFGITSIFKFLKSANWSAVCPSARSRSWMSVNLDEHTQRRYESFIFAQN